MRIYPVFIPHSGCPFKCIYCNQNIITRKADFSIHQFKPEIDRFLDNDNSSEREVAFFGGTFTSLPQSEQKVLLKSVTESPFFNAKTTFVRFSTRPDSFLKSDMSFYKAHNTRVVELGIQSFSNKELSCTKRGYNSQTAIEACNKVKDSGFKLCVQLMPGLPGFTGDTFNETISVLKDVKPDYVRIYPVIVLKDTELADMFKRNKYAPLSMDSALKYTSILHKECMIKNIDVIKVGLHSDVLFSSDNVVAGPYHPAFGELVQAEMYYEKIVAAYQNGKTLHISNRDMSLLKGFKQKYLKKLKIKFEIQKIPIIIDKYIEKRHIIVSDEITDIYF